MITARTAMATASPPARRAGPATARLLLRHAPLLDQRVEPGNETLVSFGLLRERRQHLGQLVSGERGGLHEP